jgi:glycosyltransferase involved in cell wall biosynthesis
MASTFPRWEGDTVPPFIYNLSERLADAGYEMHVLAPHTAGAARREKLGPLQVHRFRYAPSPIEGLAYDGGILENLKRKPARWGLVPGFFASQLYSTWRLTRRYRFDLLHVHWLIPQGLSSAMLPPWIDTPKLLTAHGGDVFASKSAVRKRIARFVANRHDAITVNSTAMRDAVAALTGKPSRVIPMGIDLDRFSENGASARDRADSSNRLLFVGRLVEKKGVEHLIRAMPSIIAAAPGASLTVVGDGPRREALEREALALGVAGSIVFKGALPNSELPSFYNNADLFIAPSVVAESGDTEALGVVLLEAAACGLPIIATRVGGISDVVLHGETGLLVEEKSPGQLANAAIELINDRPRAARLGSAARRHIVESFGWDSVALRFREIYDELIYGGPSAPGYES